MPPKYEPVIGLEIHAELKTRTKMFCDCLNDPNEAHPNVNICPICTGQPGVLPTVNKQAVEMVVKVGLALDGRIAGVSKFDRKNYFYPDLPKGYQISQYDEPFVAGGLLNGVRVRRVHLEEDAGSLLHARDEAGQEISLVDYNRAGRPLMELVTEPDIKTAKQASDFAVELQRILRYLDVSDADMERGQMRVEVNISLRPEGERELGVKVEVKNLNSFRAVEGAIEFEIERQVGLLEAGKKVSAETRGWDEMKKKTDAQRSKEEAQDYRYFPEPDIPPFFIADSGISLEKLKKDLPELPAAKRERFKNVYGLSDEGSRLITAARPIAEYFEEAISELGTEEGGAMSRARQLLFNYFTSDLWGLLKEQNIPFGDLKITPENFADLVMLIVNGKISSRSAKDILKKMNMTGEDPRDILKAEGLEQVSAVATLEIVARGILQENPQAIVDYKKGKTAAVQFLVGKAMAHLKGGGNPAILREIFIKLLV